MCLICVEIDNKRMTATEAIRALREIKAAKTDPDHVTEVLRKFLTDQFTKATKKIKGHLNER